MGGFVWYLCDGLFGFVGFVGIGLKVEKLWFGYVLVFVFKRNVILSDCYVVNNMLVRM